MDKIKVILKEYEKIIINLSEDDHLENNLKKYDNCKRLLTKQVIEKMVKVPNYESNFINTLNYLFDFDELQVADLFEYI